MVTLPERVVTGEMVVGWAASRQLQEEAEVVAVARQLERVALGT